MERRIQEEKCINNMNESFGFKIGMKVEVEKIV